jgi:hypothetical protein
MGGRESSDRNAGGDEIPLRHRISHAAGGGASRPRAHQLSDGPPAGAGTASGGYSIAGLPLAAAGGGGRTYIMNIRNSSTQLYCNGYIVGGTTTIPIFTSGVGNPSFTDQINVESVYENA